MLLFRARLNHNHIIYLNNNTRLYIICICRVTRNKLFFALYSRWNWKCRSAEKIISFHIEIYIFYARSTLLRGLLVYIRLYRAVRISRNKNNTYVILTVFVFAKFQSPCMWKKKTYKQIYETIIYYPVQLLEALNVFHSWRLTIYVTALFPPLVYQQQPNIQFRV